MSEPIMEQGKKKSRWSGCLLAGFIIGCMLLVFAIIAVPDFLKFCARAKQSEAKYNLGALYKLQMEYRAEHGSFAGHTADQDCFQLLNWRPEGNTLYAYYCDTAEIPNTRGTDHSDSRPPVMPVTKDHFVIIAVGNLDNDPELDYWCITEKGILRNRLVLAGGDVVGSSDL